MRQPIPRVFITVAGNLTAPDQAPHLPITPAEIAEACLGAAAAQARERLDLRPRAAA